jgi:hypothetical protein
MRLDAAAGSVARASINNLGNKAGGQVRKPGKGAGPPGGGGPGKSGVACRARQAPVVLTDHGLGPPASTTNKQGKMISIKHVKNQVGMCAAAAGSLKRHAGSSGDRTRRDHPLPVRFWVPTGHGLRLGPPTTPLPMKIPNLPRSSASCARWSSCAARWRRCRRSGTSSCASPTRSGAVPPSLHLPGPPPVAGEPSACVRPLPIHWLRQAPKRAPPTSYTPRAGRRAGRLRAAAFCARHRGAGQRGLLRPAL